MPILNVVKFNGLKSRDWLIYKYPADDITTGSQLIVQEGQVALFVEGGSIVAKYDPGTYTLTTENLPILKNIISIPFGGKTPFSAEVYFVNTTLRLDITWGTSDPISLVDPKYYVKLRVRAFGQMTLKVIDAQGVFENLIGGMNPADVVKFDRIKEYYRGLLVIKIKTAIADAIITKGISALDISTKLETISGDVKESIKQFFDDYGFEVVNFYVKSINFPDEDFEKINKILEDKAAFEIMGDDRYSAKRTFDVYEGAANNSGNVAATVLTGNLGAGMGRLHNAIGGKSDHKNCIKCGAEMPTVAKYCMSCGADNSERQCECGKMLQPGTKFCPECGKKVEL